MIVANWIPICAFIVAGLALTLGIVRTYIAFVEHRWKKEKYENRRT